MKSFKIAFGLAVMAGLMAVVAVPAMAAPVWVQCKPVTAGTGKWSNNLCNKREAGAENWETKEVTETEEVTSSANKLELVDLKATGGESKIECTGTDVGWVGANGKDGISQITATGCKRITGACNTGEEVRATAIDLPWDTELVEESNGEVRDRAQAGGKGPGYKVECKASIFKVVDECFGTTSTKQRNNQANGTVESEFEAKSPKGECTLGGPASGEVKGVDVTKQRTERGLKVSGNKSE